MKIPVKNKALFDSYPGGDKSEVAQIVGGTIGDMITKHNYETCCIRLSRALNDNAQVIAITANMTNPYMQPPKIRALPGADKKAYIYSVYDLRAYLTTKYGTPRRFTQRSEVDGLEGVIMFGFRHVDVWDGTKCKRLELFDHESTKMHGIMLWPTNPNTEP